MPTTRITEEWVRGVAVESRREFRDDQLRGFYCRVSPQGSRAFGVVVTPRGRTSQVRVTIGRWPQWSAKAARAKAQTLLLEASQGIVATTARSATANSATVAELVESWQELHVRPNLRTAAELERLMRVDVLPRWGDRLASSITRADVIALGDELVARGAPAAAAKLIDVLRGMFAWAVRRERLTHNPAAGIRDPVRQVPRERWLTAEEIVELWRSLDRAGEPTSRQLLRFLLITAQRTRDAWGMSAGEIQGDVWEIPAARYKSWRRAHLVPLTPLALAYLPLHLSDPQAQVHRYTIGSLMRRVTADWPGGRATPHDLRRTAQTHMGRLGIPRFARDRVLGHADTRLGSTYDRWEYLDEKRAALTAWNAWLADSVGVDIGKLRALRSH